MPLPFPDSLKPPKSTSEPRVGPWHGRRDDAFGGRGPNTCRRAGLGPPNPRDGGTALGPARAAGHQGHLTFQPQCHMNLLLPIISKTKKYNYSR
jgi:hypothetical protein